MKEAVVCAFVLVLTMPTISWSQQRRQDSLANQQHQAKRHEGEREKAARITGCFSGGRYMTLVQYALPQARRQTWQEGLADLDRLITSCY